MSNRLESTRLAVADETSGKNNGKAADVCDFEDVDLDYEALLNEEPRQRDERGAHQAGG